MSNAAMVEMTPGSPAPVGGSYQANSLYQ